MVSRRTFLQGTAGAAGAAMAGGFPGWPYRLGFDHFSLHPFVERHPDAVFVLLTAVAAKTDTETIRDVGYRFGKSLFVPSFGGHAAFPIAGNLAIKPNLTSWAWDIAPIETTMGIQTDANFVEGIVGSLADLGVAASNIYVRDANYSADRADGVWYKEMAARTGINLASGRPIAQLMPDEIQWASVPRGVWFRNLPYFWPINTPKTCLLNIAKLKSHSMGMTLCAKNLQGANVAPYVVHCAGWGSPMSGVDAQDQFADASETVRANYERHKETIPRWKTLDGDPAAASAGGLWMETHSSRCLDNNAAVRPTINIIEGIYGREGPFVAGPSAEGYGIDVMTNVVIFGKNALHVDAVGVYLAGHEPGNFGLFHMAVERGLSQHLNPRDIALYEWNLHGMARPVSIERLPRTPLRTLYLPQAGEERYHLIDEPYDYGPSTPRPPHKPRWRKLHSVVTEPAFPHPSHRSPSIQYYLPASGNVRIEVLDLHGTVVDVLADKLLSAGDHLQTWHATGRAPGVYGYRILFDGMRNEGILLLPE